MKGGELVNSFISLRALNRGFLWFNKKLKAFQNIQFVYMFVDKHNLFQKLKAGYMVFVTGLR